MSQNKTYGAMYFHARRTTTSFTWTLYVMLIIKVQLQWRHNYVTPTACGRRVHGGGVLILGFSSGAFCGGNHGYCGLSNLFHRISSRIWPKLKRPTRYWEKHIDLWVHDTSKGQTPLSRQRKWSLLWGLHRGMPSRHYSPTSLLFVKSGIAFKGHFNYYICQ